MSPGVPTKIIGVAMGLTGFAVALISGLAAENPAESVLLRALAALVACQVVGWALGAVGERVIRDALRDFRASNPINMPSTPGARAAVDSVQVVSSLS